MIDPGQKERLIEKITNQNGEWIRFMAKNNAFGDTWQDLEQEILLALWRSLERFNGQSSLETWIYAVVQNTVKNFKRRSRNIRKRDERVAPNTGFVEQTRDEGRIIEDFMDLLGDLDRRVFLMYLNDIGYRDMSSQIGIDEANLRKRLSRIKEQFKAKYDGY